MAANDKDTIYVDVDDEITTIIDKVRGSNGRIIALVLPKRATVFQSIVNMKLLKRAADADKKHLVLITTEANLMPLAGAVGLHVASTPQSKPEIPPTAAPAAPEDEIAEESVEAPDDEEYTADNAGDRPVGDLARGTGHVVGPAAADTAVTLDDDGGDEEEPEGDGPIKDRRLKVPNFNKFRLRLALGILLLALLIVGLYVANVVLPHAAIAITTNTSQINVSFTPTLDAAAQTLDTSKLILPAKSEQQQQTTSQQVATTGQQNTGNAAKGNVTMTAQEGCNGAPLQSPAKVPAGSGVSTNGLTFITQQDATFSYSGISQGCVNFISSPVAIVAQSAGAKYNVGSGTPFAVAGRSDVTATGSTSGGTDNIIKIVAQADIDSAKQKLASQDTTSIKASLEQALLNDGMYPLEATFNAGTPVITTSNNVGDQADNVTVTQAITYTMYGAKKADIDTLIKNNIGSQINISTQSILDDGLSNATISVTNTTGTTVLLSLQTTAVVGPDINANNIKHQAAGKKVGDVQAMINAIPGVTNVSVRLSPFWVSTVPTNSSHVTVTIDKK